MQNNRLDVIEDAAPEERADPFGNAGLIDHGLFYGRINQAVKRILQIRFEPALIFFDRLGKMRVIVSRANHIYPIWYQALPSKRPAWVVFDASRSMDAAADEVGVLAEHVKDFSVACV